MGRYAANTTVSVERSLAELRRVLNRYGCEGFGYIDEGGRTVVAFTLRQGDLRLPLRFDLEAPEGDAKELRRRWRCLILIVKAKLEAIENEVADPYRELGPYLVLPNGSTVGERLQADLEGPLLEGKLPRSLPALMGGSR